MTDTSPYGDGPRTPHVHGGGAVPPPPPYQPAAAPDGGADHGGPGRRTERTAALVAAVALVAGVVGGGSAALIGHVSHTGGSTSSVAVSTASTHVTDGVAGVVAADAPSIVEITADNGEGESIGSGVVVDSAGDIVTNNHVIADSDSVKVTFSDGTSDAARVVTADPTKDLAVVKVSGAGHLKVATLGDSGRVAVGDQVVAIGSPEGLAGTVTSGVVSALNRSVTVPVEGSDGDGSGSGGSNGGSGGFGRGRSGDQWPFEFGGGQYNGRVGSQTTSYRAIQTDASLNPGNSGGALIDMAGQVIGINSAMYAPSSSSDSSQGSDSAGSVGLGFAIPVNTVKAFLTGHHIGYTV